MKIMLIHPGAGYSTFDVWAGYVGGLRALGHEVGSYRLDNAVDSAASWLRWRWEHEKREDGLTWKEAGREAPNSADEYYWGGLQSVQIALTWKPDWVIVISGAFLLRDYLKMLKACGPKLALLCTESPYDDPEQKQYAEHCDAVFTQERSSVGYLAEAAPCYYLPAAYDPARHSPRAAQHLIAGVGNGGSGLPAVDAHDVVHVGFMFAERAEIIGGADWSGVDLGLYGVFDCFEKDDRFTPHIRGGITSNDRTAALYCRAKVGLNIMRTSIGWGEDTEKAPHAESLNPRAYELAACGAFQLATRRAELEDVFGDAVPSFEDAGDLQEQVRYYLDRPLVRKRLAREARRRAEPHTFTARAVTLTRALEAGG